MRLLTQVLMPEICCGTLKSVVHFHLHFHLGHLADTFIQSDLQRVHVLKEKQQYITVVHKDKNRAGFKHS